MSRRALWEARHPLNPHLLHPHLRQSKSFSSRVSVAVRDESGRWAVAAEKQYHYNRVHAEGSCSAKGRGSAF